MGIPSDYHIELMDQFLIWHNKLQQDGAYKEYKKTNKNATIQEYDYINKLICEFSKENYIVGCFEPASGQFMIAKKHETTLFIDSGGFKQFYRKNKPRKDYWKVINGVVGLVAITISIWSFSDSIDTMYNTDQLEKDIIQLKQKQAQQDSILNIILQNDSL